MTDGHAWAFTRAGPEHAEAVRALTREAYGKWVPVVGREPLPMQADHAAAVQRHQVDLLCLDERLVGLIEMIPEADHLMVENVAVSPDFQNKGFGRMLMAHAEQVARSLGHREIRLYTNKLFAENVRLYRRLGYSVDREEEFAGGLVVHMSKPIYG